MISFVRGKVARALPNLLWVDVGGVGYEIHVPMGAFDHAPEGSDLRVLTHLHVREDAMTLYGFANEEQRELFLLLVERVTGIGPKLAMTILGGLPTASFKAAVVNADATALARIRGVGKKTAERIVLELKDKLGVAEVWQQAAAASPAESARHDAVLALLALGYKQVDAVKAVRAASESGGVDGEDAGADALVRAALRQLNR